MPISDFFDLMPRVITHYAITSKDTYGKPVYATSGTEYKCRITYKTRRVVSRVTGEDVLSNGTIWVGGVISTLTADDKILLDDDSIPVIASWDHVDDEVGPHHTKIFLRG